MSILFIVNFYVDLLLHMFNPSLILILIAGWPNLTLLKHKSHLKYVTDSNCLWSNCFKGNKIASLLHRVAIIFPVLWSPNTVFLAVAVEYSWQQLWMSVLLLNWWILLSGLLASLSLLKFSFCFSAPQILYFSYTDVLHSFEVICLH